MPLEHLPKPRKIIIQVRQVAGYEYCLRMLLDRSLQAFDQAVVPQDSRLLLIDSPAIAVHEPVIMQIHGLIRPDGVRHVDVDRHAQLRALVPYAVHARIVGVRSRREGWTIRTAGSAAASSGAKAPALVAHFAHSECARIVAGFEGFDGVGSESRLVTACEIETAPEIESAGILGVAAADFSKALSRVRSGKYDRLLDTSGVHDFHHLIQPLDWPGAVAMHVDGGVFRALDIRLRYRVEGLRPVVLQKELFRRILSL